MILAMNLQIINDCAGTDHRLPTAGNDPGRRFNILCTIVSNYLYVSSVSNLKYSGIHNMVLEHRIQGRFVFRQCTQLSIYSLWIPDFKF